MIRFCNDYSEVIHPKILGKLVEVNTGQAGVYGEDTYCERARELIKGLCGNDDLHVRFVVGGTLANLLVISASLRPHQCVISPTTGHVATLEAGAIEATGHKVSTISTDDGKITAEQIESFYSEYTDSDYRVHIAQPKLVFISFPTEYGTLYTKDELQAISDVCKDRNLYLYIDGARLGYGLCAEGNDVDLKFITESCDAFYIGGTKQGALLGEAIVIKNENIAEDFTSIIKQRGGLLAKGMILGLQFTALFEDDLYFELSKHANKMASLVRDALKKKGVEFFIESQTNQLFPILQNGVLEGLSEKYLFANWKKVDDESSVIRICTSWATTEESIGKLIADMEASLEQSGE
ncbi:MAG: aminotransferase class I/II-fold pyridoxal phosphate-dependent enzyme [Holosporales bacterium]|jgi:threonine aldolase|nr:aminotransferase class I/II-fold pyridoxal phosphate-dependent enzyme [Holosporales bacterium]